MNVKGIVTLTQVRYVLDKLSNIKDLRARHAHCEGFYDSLLNQYSRDTSESNKRLLSQVSVIYSELSTQLNIPTRQEK